MSLPLRDGSYWESSLFVSSALLSSSRTAATPAGERKGGTNARAATTALPCRTASRHHHTACTAYAAVRAARRWAERLAVAASARFGLRQEGGLRGGALASWSCHSRILRAHSRPAARDRYCREGGPQLGARVDVSGLRDQERSPPPYALMYFSSKPRGVLVGIPLRGGVPRIHMHY